MSTPLHEAEASFESSPGGGLIIRKDQIITEEQLTRNAEMRNYEGREHEFMEVASVPTVVVEIWQRQGFDIFDRNITSRDIVNRLKSEGLDAFVTTSKKV
jgi:hypothetical protein